VLRDLAPAKINLFLHVLGRRADGYHSLESLVSFADIGDDLALDPGPALSLVIDGPMAAGLAAEDDNLVLRAGRLFAEAFPEAGTGRFHLTKNLPVASGIGGGSSDAAAALRLLASANKIEPFDPKIMNCARALGADVPVCLETRPRLMRGIGHELGPVLSFLDQPAVLINPGVALETRAVFAALGLKPGERHIPPGTVDIPIAGMGALLRLRTASRNHLEPPARKLASKISRVIDALDRQPGCQLARMSGSGATCFALFPSLAAAKAAEAALSVTQPRWWVRAATLH